MSLNQILVTVGGVLLIYFIYWFFLTKKKKLAVASDTTTILVEGGYTPEVISLPLGKPTTITFLRKDPSSCLEEVVLADFKIRKFLPLNEKVSFTLTPEKAGEYNFSCGMNMYHGKIVVKG